MDEVIARRYILQAPLGAGGMGTVYRAFDSLTREQVAIKSVKPSPTESAHVERQNKFALTSEFKTLSTLRHPNIINVIDYGFDDTGYPYFTMQYLKDAKDILNLPSTLNQQEKALYLIQLLQAIKYLHRRKLLHRDIKPSNVLISNDNVYVLDFGLSGVEVQEVQRMASLPYAAPEIVMEHPATVETDVYAIGMIAYELFTGEYPFAKDSMRGLVEDIIARPIDFSKVSGRLRFWLEKMLARNPKQRYSKIGDVIVDLANAVHLAPPKESVAIRESFLQAAKFVGREIEVEQLRVGINRAINQKKGSVWLVTGEAGVGKTRLVDEIRTIALVDGMIVLRGQSHGQTDIAYQLWVDILRHLVVGVPLSDADVALLKRVVPDISEILERNVPKRPSMDAESEQKALINLILSLFRQSMGQVDSRQPIGAVRRIIQRLTYGKGYSRPMVLILEDLHQTSSENLNILQSLIELTRDLPLLIIGTYIDEESPDLPDEVPHAHVIKLSRLEREEITALSVAMLGPGGRVPFLVDFLEKETEGNVFFLVEVIRALAETSGQLDSITGMRLPFQVFTGGIRKLLVRRLKDLSPAELAVLQVAAVVGRRLDLKVLNYLMHTAPDGTESINSVYDINLDQWLTVCLNAAILETQDGRWEFTHDKLREGILIDLPLSEEQALHRRTAMAIENVYLHAQEQIPRLAYHWSEAKQPEKHRHYAEQAGELALRNGAYEEARQYFQTALDFQPDDSAITAKKQSMLYRQLGNAYLYLVNQDAAQKAYQESLRLAREVDYKWGLIAALNHLGHLYHLRQQTSAARACFNEGVQIAIQVRAQSLALASLTGIAGMMIDEKQVDKPAEILYFVLEHVAVDRETAHRADVYLTRLKLPENAMLLDKAKEAAIAQNLTNLVETLD